MNRYKLTAKAGDILAIHSFKAESDTSAMFESIGVILEKAMTQQIWAKGEITLLDDAGEVVASMEGKN